MKELSDQGIQDENAAFMDIIASMDFSKIARNSKLHQAVVEKLKYEPQRLTDVMDILEDNASNDFMKRGTQALKKRHTDLLCQLTAQESQEDTGGIIVFFRANVVNLQDG